MVLSKAMTHTKQAKTKRNEYSEKIGEWWDYNAFIGIFRLVPLIDSYSNYSFSQILTFIYELGMCGQRHGREKNELAVARFGMAYRFSTCFTLCVKQYATFWKSHFHWIDHSRQLKELLRAIFTIKMELLSMHSGVYAKLTSNPTFCLPRKWNRIVISTHLKKMLQHQQQ